MIVRRALMVGVLLAGFCSAAWATPLVHEWSNRYGDENTQLTDGVAVDGSGNVVVVGSFAGTLDFGGGVLPYAGSADMYLVKFDANGNHLWSKSFGDASVENCTAVAVDPSGNIIIGGYFQGTVDFGGGPLVSAGANDAFAAKFDANGNHIWSQRYGDWDDQWIYSVTVDDLGDVILANFFRGTVDFGGGPLTSAGDEDIVVAKLDPGGNHLWSKRFGDSDAQRALHAATDASGNIFVTGWFNGSADFGGGTLTSAGGSDAFVAKFDPNGNHLWSKRFGDSSNQEGRSVAVDASGDPVVAGHFGGAIDLGGGALTSAGGEDIFLAKLDASGNHLWSERFGDSDAQWVFDVALDPSGNAVIVGYYYGTVDFGGGGLVSAGDEDMFIAQFDESGSHVWSQRYGDDLPASQRFHDVATDAVGNVVVVGEFGGTIDFGGGPLVSPVSFDICVIKFSQSPGEPTVSVAPSSALTNCTTPITYTFAIDGFAGPVGIRGYEVTFQIDPAVATIANVATDVLEGTYLDSFGDAQFFCVDKGGGVYKASGAILGTTAGASGPGNLFTVKLTPADEGTSATALASLKLRDVNNVPIPVGGGGGGGIRVDCTLPKMQAIVEPQNECYNHAPTFAVFKFRDDVGLDTAEWDIDGSGWDWIFPTWPDTVWGSPGWTLPGFSGLSEGSHTAHFRVKDDAGNYNTGSYSWSFVKDMVAPAAPTNFVAMPGHNKVHLTWTNPAGDTSWEGVEIRRVAWGDYADYSGSGPSYPGDENAGDSVTVTALATYDDLVTPRDIYYYAAFSYDCAGNYSSGTTTSRDRSTSYWLGDIDPDMTPGPPGDGDIDLVDLSNFASVFGKIEGGGDWNEEGDFGPTDDWSRFGVPMPDNMVDFEDLMIFAMNYMNVSPSGTSGALIALTETMPLREQVSFRLVPVSRKDGKTTYAVVMENASDILKGFSLKVSYGVGNALESATASRELTGKANEHFFGVIEHESGVVEICVAALGVNKPFEYTGEVARVVVREQVEGSVGLKTVDLRDINNGRDEVTLPGTGGDVPYIPVTTALMQNHPNPFNPSTTIAFDVATAGNVRIEVYDVSGALVRTLVNEEKGVGRHVATWDGRDGMGNQVHTGVYFYRMTARGYMSPARKMVLLK